MVGTSQSYKFLSDPSEQIYRDIGLASKLPSRLSHHLKDRHAGNWDRFNFYAIRSKKYIKDLESILIRVAQPEGNRQRGGFGKDKNLRRTLRKEIIESIRADFNAA